MIYIKSFSNYEGFKEVFGFIEHGNGVKSRKNKILLGVLKDRKFIHRCLGSEKDAKILSITSMAEMKNYLHRKSQHMDGNFADLSMDYPKHRTGTFWVSEYDGPVAEYFSLYPDMVARLDAAEDSEQADEDREYLAEWFFDAFGTFGIKYNFSNELDEIAYMIEEESVTA